MWSPSLIEERSARANRSSYLTSRAFRHRRVTFRIVLVCVSQVLDWCVVAQVTALDERYSIARLLERQRNDNSGWASANNGYIRVDGRLVVQRFSIS